MIVTQFVKTNLGWDVYSSVTNVGDGATVGRESFEKIGLIRETKVPGDKGLVFVIDTDFADWELGPKAMSAVVSHILANENG